MNRNCYPGGEQVESVKRGEGCSPPDLHSPRIIPSGVKEGIEGMNVFGLILKCFATALLIIAFVILAGLLLVMAPFYILLIVKGKAKASVITQIIPLGIVATFIWKLWKPEGLSDTERAYYDGITEGQIKASRIAGRIEGARMISVPEDLSLKPVYSLRAIPRKSSQGTDIPY
jgi:hypothetical protein